MEIDSDDDISVKQGFQNIKLKAKSQGTSMSLNTQRNISAHSCKDLRGWLRQCLGDSQQTFGGSTPAVALSWHLCGYPLIPNKWAYQQHLVHHPCVSRVFGMSGTWLVSDRFRHHTVLWLYVCVCARVRWSLVVFCTHVLPNTFGTKSNLTINK